MSEPVNPDQPVEPVEPVEPVQPEQPAVEPVVPAQPHVEDPEHEDIVRITGEDPGVQSSSLRQEDVEDYVANLPASDAELAAQAAAERAESEQTEDPSARPAGVVEPEPPAVDPLAPPEA